MADTPQVDQPAPPTGEIVTAAPGLLIVKTLDAIVSRQETARDLVQSLASSEPQFLPHLEATEDTMLTLTRHIEIHVPIALIRAELPALREIAEKLRTAPPAPETQQ